jgi:hypothetical protein
MKNNIDELKIKINQIMALENLDIDKLYQEMLTIFSETKDDFIQRRHGELKKLGFKNNDIFKILQDEVTSRLFKGEKLSERQIKRIIYQEN